MSTRLAPRLMSFALAVLVTWSVFIGIDTLALEQHAGALQMSQVPAAMQIAATKPAARS